MASNFRWEGELVTNLSDFNENAEKAMKAGALFVSSEMQSFMRSEATWTDRTGNARSGLTTTVQSGRHRIAIILFHRVPYGPFLEVRWGGKYGIIAPAMAAGGPRLIEIVGRLMFK